MFRAGLGTLQGFKAKIIIEDNAIPKFCKARSIPYAFKEMVKKELNRLVSEGTLEPVQFSEWAVPIVPVLKKKTSRVFVAIFVEQLILFLSLTDTLYQRLKIDLQT